MMACSLMGGEPVAADHGANMAKGLELFKNGVRQMLAETCLKCHGGEKTKADFDLSSREALLKGGSSGVALIPGNAKGSPFFKQLTHAEEPYMPHKAPKLAPALLEQIAQWIDFGAPYDKPLLEKTGKAAPKEMVVTDKDREFWSFQPIKKVEPPALKNPAMQAWCRTPVDRFVAAKLEEQGILPSAPLERRKLIRRASFDFTGLPPTPAEVEAFVNDKSADAYEKVIDRLLASPHFGERWARHWLDAVRFAESHGFEQDYDRPFAYHFRDFVIRAFNEDLPYTKFIGWQLAGDEFEPDNPMAMMATGFLGAGVFPTQITANEVERTRYDALDDMAATTGTAMLGMTIGCARCHDHKFDPIPAKDYYRFAATFTTTVRSEVELNMNPAPYKEAKKVYDSGHAPLVQALQTFEKEKLAGRMELWLNEKASAPAPAPTAWVTLDVLESKSKGNATITRNADGSLLFTGTNAEFDTYTLTAQTNLKNILAVRLEAMADDSMKMKGPGRADNGNFALSNFSVEAAPSGGSAKPVVLKLQNPKATFEQSGLPIAATIDADAKSSWAVDPQFGKSQAASYEFEKPAGFEAGTRLTFTLKFENNKGHNIGRLRLAISTAAPALDAAPVPQISVEIGAIVAAAGGVDKINEKQKAELLGWYRSTDPEWQKLNAVVVEHQKKEPKPQTTKVMICSEGPHIKAIRHHTQGGDFLTETHILKRGDTGQKQGIATPGFLTALLSSDADETQWQETRPPDCKTSYRRRTLANWMIDTKKGAGNMLARVITNRLWHHHFGHGIVATPNDFGFQGERPTHPELLDWLAQQLIENGWHLKPIHKLIATSAVYMQGTQAINAAQAVENDPRAKVDNENKWIWRRDRHRLEAESIRDTMLFASGQLQTQLYGPGTLDEGNKRRSIYFTTKRSKLIPILQLFDAPEPTVSIGSRSSTTIAPQALLFINNAQVRGYARSLATRLVEAIKTQPDAEKFKMAAASGYMMAVGRQATPAELADSAAFMKQQMDSYSAAKKANAQELALLDFCQVLLSLNEFVYVE